MLSYSFTDLTLSSFFFMFIMGLWFVYYTFINNITVPAILSTDVKQKKKIDLNGNTRIVIFSLFCTWLCIINYTYIQNIDISGVLWGTLQMSNSTLNYLYLIIFILLIILTSSTYLFNQNLSFTTEYLIFVLLIGVSGFFLLSSNSLFLTIFLLELVALLIFGKFAVSRVMFNQNSVNLTKTSNTPTYSFGLFNSLFFQFWANFVSSVFLFFSLISIHYSFGTSNFFFLNFFFSILSQIFSSPEQFTMFSLLIFTTGLFIKLGMSPYQFFKIETYKGIPLYMVIVYTTLYLAVYIYFFSFFFTIQVPYIRTFIGIFVLFFLTFSVFYLVNLLFDTKNFKAFLSYSTLITIINLFVMILVL